MVGNKIKREFKGECMGKRNRRMVRYPRRITDKKRE